VWRLHMIAEPRVAPLDLVAAREELEQ